MNRILILLASLLVVGNAYAEENSSVSELVGKYFPKTGSIKGSPPRRWRLAVDVDNGSLNVEIKYCFEDYHTSHSLCAFYTLDPNPDVEGGRRISGTMTLQNKSHKLTAPKNVLFQAMFSKSGQEIKGNFGRYRLQGEKSSSD